MKAHLWRAGAILVIIVDPVPSFYTRNSSPPDAGHADPAAFLYDTTTGALRRLMHLPGLEYRLGAREVTFAFNHDGRFVTISAGVALDPRDVNTTTCAVDYIGLVNCPDVYLFDQTTGSLALIALTPSGTVPDRGAEATSLSADGRCVSLLFDDGGPPASREYDVRANSRLNVSVLSEFPEAMNRGFGAVIESLPPTAVPLVVERAMYNDAGGVLWRAGSVALGTRLP